MDHASTEERCMIIKWHIRQQHISLFVETLSHLIFLFLNSPSFCCFGIGKNECSELSPIEENEIDIHKEWTWLDDYNDKISHYNNVYINSNKLLLYNHIDHQIYIKGWNINGECCLGFKSYSVGNFISLQAKCNILSSNLIASASQVLIAPFRDYFMILLKFHNGDSNQFSYNYSYRLFIEEHYKIIECNQNDMTAMIPTHTNIIKIERVYQFIVFYCNDHNNINTISIYGKNELKHDCQIQDVLWPKDWMYLQQKAPNGKVKMIKNGTCHTCVIYENGDCYLFGSNDDGQLGSHKKKSKLQDRFFKMVRFQSSFDEFKDMQIVDASLGHEHTILISDKNDVIAFGSNVYQQCGETARERIAFPHIMSKVTEMGFESEDAYIYRVIAGHHITIVFTDSKHLESELMSDYEDDCVYY